jgi:RNA polymerase sigma-70 factor (ECF subfamily)
VRLVHGQYDLNSPAQLVQLLAVMARNKLVSHVNKQQAARRDVRRMELLDDPAVEMAGREATPSRIVSARELLKNFRERLSPEERLLADARAAGRSWVELGREQGEDPDVLRKRFARAVERVAGQLGLESQSDV